MRPDAIPNEPALMLPTRSESLLREMLTHVRELSSTSQVQYSGAGVAGLIRAEIQARTSTAAADERALGSTERNILEALMEDLSTREQLNAFGAGLLIDEVLARG